MKPVVIGICVMLLTGLYAYQSGHLDNGDFAGFFMGRK
jgi:hypothetical protein